LPSEPDQVIDVLAKTVSRKPFEVLLRVHSYATEPGKVTVRTRRAAPLEVTAPVTLSFAGVGDQFARFQVTPPANLATR